MDALFPFEIFLRRVLYFRKGESPRPETGYERVRELGSYGLTEGINGRRFVIHDVESRVQPCNLQ